MATANDQRSAAEIQASIERSRAQLSDSLGKLRGEVTELTDWRAHLRRNQQAAAGAAAAAGFVLAGGLGSVTTILLNQIKRLFKRSGD